MKTETLTDNELIEEFFVSHGGGPIIVKADVDFYQASWDMLMPVVGKMFSLWQPASEGFQKSVNLKLDKFRREVPIGSHIQQVHKEVIVFIKWYNQHKQ